MLSPHPPPPSGLRPRSRKRPPSALGPSAAASSTTSPVDGSPGRWTNTSCRRASMTASTTPCPPARQPRLAPRAPASAGSRRPPAALRQRSPSARAVAIPMRRPGERPRARAHRDPVERRPSSAPACSRHSGNQRQQAVDMSRPLAGRRVVASLDRRARRTPVSATVVAGVAVSKARILTRSPPAARRPRRGSSRTRAATLAQRGECPPRRARATRRTRSCPDRR